MILVNKRAVFLGQSTQEASQRPDRLAVFLSPLKRPEETTKQFAPDKIAPKNLPHNPGWVHPNWVHRFPLPKQALRRSGRCGRCGQESQHSRTALEEKLRLQLARSSAFGARLLSVTYTKYFEWGGFLLTHEYMAMVQNQRYHLGVGAPSIFVDFSGH